jgi:hypothetical protein
MARTAERNALIIRKERGRKLCHHGEENSAITRKKTLPSRGRKLCYHEEETSICTRGGGVVGDMQNLAIGEVTCCSGYAANTVEILTLRPL